MIVYAHNLSDVDMEVVALIGQGLLYSYELRPSLRHSTLRRAMQLVEKIQSPLIRKQVFFGYAESIEASGQTELAGSERYFEAERYFDMAESLSVPDDDPGRAYFQHNCVTQAIHRARFFVARRDSATLSPVLIHFLPPDGKLYLKLQQ